MSFPSQSLNKGAIDFKNVVLLLNHRPTLCTICRAAICGIISD